MLQPLQALFEDVSGIYAGNCMPAGTAASPSVPASQRPLQGYGRLWQRGRRIMMRCLLLAHARSAQANSSHSKP
jgi:hypothetical protein